MLSTHRVRCVSTVLCAAGLFTGIALAEPPADSNQPPAPLQGPKVDKRTVPGVDGSFGAPGELKRRAAAGEIPLRAFVKAITDALASENTPADIKASDELLDKVRAAESEFNAAQRKYQKDHQADMEAIRKAGDSPRAAQRQGQNPQRPNAGGSDGAKPDEMMAPMDEKAQAEQAALMEKAREIRENAPKPQDVQTKIWALLSEKQQAATNVQLDVFRAEQQKRRDEEYIKRQVQQKQGDKTQPPPPAAGDAPAAPVRRPNAEGRSPAPPAGTDAPQRGGLGAQFFTPEQRERLMRVLSRMTPEEREQLLQRLEERVKDRPAPNADRPGEPGAPKPPAAPARGRGRGQSGPEGTDKPAPKPEDIKIPKPDGLV